MMLALDELYQTYQDRKNNRGLIIERMRQVRDQYNGDVTVPLPELDANEKVAVANLLAQGLDQLAMRTASTVPEVFCPSVRPGIKTHDDRANTRRKAILGWWSANTMHTLARYRARYFYGYGAAPVAILPDYDRKIPYWQIRDPLSTYPGATLNPGNPVPPNTLTCYTRPYSWVKATFPGVTYDVKPDTAIEIIEWVDSEVIQWACAGPLPSGYGYRDRYDAAVYGTGGNAKLIRNLGTVPNRTGRPLVITPGRVTLDRIGGQFDGILGMYQMQAKLMALEVHAVTKGVFPDTWAIAHPNSTGPVKIINVANGVRGEVGELQGGVIQTINPQPGVATYPTMDRLERAQRLTGGIPAELGGESTSNIRTGRRGDQVLSASIDYYIQEAQDVMATSLIEENRAAVAVTKAFFPGNKSFYVSWKGATGQVDYSGATFDTDNNVVTYKSAGTDVNSLVIGGGQRVGMGTMSKRGFMELDPMVTDPEREHDRIQTEALEQALLSSLQQQAASGAIAATDLAWIMAQVATNKMELAQAIQAAHDRAQTRQASAGPPGTPEGPVAPGTPEAQPGLQPATPAGQPTVGPMPGGLDNAMMLLRTLRQRPIPANAA